MRVSTYFRVDDALRAIMNIQRILLDGSDASLVTGYFHICSDPDDGLSPVDIISLHMWHHGYMCAHLGLAPEQLHMISESEYASRYDKEVYLH